MEKNYFKCCCGELSVYNKSEYVKEIVNWYLDDNHKNCQYCEYCLTSFTSNEIALAIRFDGFIVDYLNNSPYTINYAIKYLLLNNKEFIPANEKFEIPISLANLNNDEIVRIIIKLIDNLVFE